MARVKFLSITACIVIAGTALSTALTLAAGADAQNAEQVAQGQVVYQQVCASCHGTNLEGEANWRTRKANGRLPAPPQDESGHTWHHPDQQLFLIVKEGVQAVAGSNYQSDMLAFAETLTDEEIWAVLAYIKSTWPQNIQARQDLLTQQYQGP